MLIELSGLNDRAIFINIEDVSAIVQKKKTIIYLKNGVKLIVQESAGDVKREIDNKIQETIMEKLTNAGSFDLR